MAPADATVTIETTPASATANFFLHPGKIERLLMHSGSGELLRHQTQAAVSILAIPFRIPLAVRRELEIGGPTPRRDSETLNAWDMAAALRETFGLDVNPYSLGQVRHLVP